MPKTNWVGGLVTGFAVCFLFATGGWIVYGFGLITTDTLKGIFIGTIITLIVMFAILCVNCLFVGMRDRENKRLDKLD